jgi:tripartite-type tricarboxylate transporter receptor subunit TctC
MELFKGMAGINMVTIIYKGGAQAVTDVIGGQVQLTVNNPIVVLPHVKSGRLRALAVTSAQRLAAARNCRPSPNRACPDSKLACGTASLRLPGCRPR